MSHLLLYSDITKFRVQMNDFSKRRKSFLFVVNYEMDEMILCSTPLQTDEILFAIGESGSSKKRSVDNEESGILNIFPIEKEEYADKFAIIHQGLKRGNSFLANLTVKTPIETNLSLEDIFYRSKAPYRICLPGRFACFSPERFVKIANGEISSNPMKGTISASVPNAEQKILSDFKETAEHATIVDLIRNDLSMVAEHVAVKRFRYIDRIKTNRNEEILQVSSEITGKLPENYNEHLGDILAKLLPAGSICGAPKKATVELIHQAEKERRGFYSGVFGYFDGENFDSAVMIRYIEEENGKKQFRSGGGITAYSRCEDEYNEVLEKVYIPFENN